MVEADSEAGNLPVLIVELLGLVMMKGLLVLDSSSHPVCKVDYIRSFICNCFPHFSFYSSQQ